MINDDLLIELSVDRRYEVLMQLFLDEIRSGGLDALTTQLERLSREAMPHYLCLRAVLDKVLPFVVEEEIKRL